MKIKGTNLAAEIQRRLTANKLAPFPVYDTEVINDLIEYNDMITKQSDLNNVKVTYCSNCLSLKVKAIPFNPSRELQDHLDNETSGPSYCVPCGNTDMSETHIHDWERLYEEKYGNKFLDEE